MALLKATYTGRDRRRVHAHHRRRAAPLGARAAGNAPAATSALSDDDKRRILERLTAADGLERYLHTKYVGQKRFSLEGGDSLIPLLDELIRRGGADGMKDIVLGMAHRGRLNVLVNILGKSPQKLFAEFDGKFDHPTTIPRTPAT